MRCRSAVAIAPLLLVIACGSSPRPSTTQEREALPNSPLLHRCVDFEVNKALPRSAPQLKLTSASVDLSIGLTCSFESDDGLSVSLYQYSDDAEFRRDPLAEYRSAPGYRAVDGLGDGAYGTPAHLYSDGRVAVGQVELDFDIGTSRWKEIVTGKTTDLDREDEVSVRVARQTASKAAELGPLHNADIGRDPADLKDAGVDPDALAAILRTRHVPTPTSGLSQRFRPGALERSLDWDTEATHRTVDIALITGPKTPRAYVDELKAAAATTGYPLPNAYAPANGLGADAFGSVIASGSTFTSFTYVFMRGSDLYRVTLSSSGSPGITEDGALAFSRQFRSAP